MNCIHQKQINGGITCELLKPLGIIFLQGEGHVNHPCGKCQTFWVNNTPPSGMDNPVLQKYANRVKPLEFPKPLSFVDRAISYGKALVSHVSAGMPEISDEEYEKRWAICSGCEYLRGENGSERCGICSCSLRGDSFITNKLRHPGQSCPINKWSAITT